MTIVPPVLVKLLPPLRAMDPVLDTVTVPALEVRVPASWSAVPAGPPGPMARVPPA